jgi:hypothetical protein
MSILASVVSRMVRRSILRPSSLLIVALLGSTLTFAQPPAPNPDAPAAAPAPSAPAPAPIARAKFFPPSAPAPASDADLPRTLSALAPLEQRYMQHVVTLTNPWLEGREPGDRGNELAAEYLQFWFRNLKLRPAFPSVAKAADGTEVRTPWTSFRQTMPLRPRPVVAEHDVAFMNASGPYGQSTPGERLVLDDDFSVLGLSDSGAAEGPVTFVGYAINNPQRNYTTFAKDDDLTGQIALVMRYEPLDERGRSRWRTTGGFSAASALAPKIRACIERGAAAVVVVNPPGVDEPGARQLMSIRSGTPRRASAEAGTNPGTTPVIMLSQAAAERLVAKSGRTLDELRRLADDKAADQPGLIPLSTSRLSIRVKVERPRVMTDNVAGVLRGKGALADQYVVIGGHLDHVGYGYFGSRDERPEGKLHAGADDNASGTAGVLIAAEALRELYAKLPSDASARSIIFIGFTAEESGLEGARFFVRNAPVPADKIYAMLNMDMIGRVFDNRLHVMGIETAKGFVDVVGPLLADSGFHVRTLPGGRGPSDHAVFFAESIPVLHFFSGLHADYHMPADTFEKINYTGGVRVAALVSRVGMLLAQRTEPLEFVSATGPSVDMTPQDREVFPSTDGATPSASPARPAPAALPPATGASAPQGAPTAAPATGTGLGGMRVRFGIAPDAYGDDTPGVGVGQVFPNTSASEAGLKAGDRILKWNDRDVASVEEWMPLLANANPGDKVSLRVKRGEETLTLQATLKGRDTPAAR